MKKLITLTTVGLMLFAGSGFAQNDSPTRDGDRERARHFRIPRLAVDNPEIKELLTAFRTASEEFKTKLAGYRTSLSAEGI